jgi:type IV pilus assembly protein PilV
MSVVIICASGLLLQSGRLARNSSQMAQASLLASELAGMLRQRLQIGSGAAWPVWLGQLDFQLAQGSGRSSASDCRLRNCDIEEALAFELNDWSSRASSVLPAARLVICRDLKPWDEAASRFVWSCDGQSGAPLLLKLGWKPPHETQSAVRPLVVMAIE